MARGKARLTSKQLPHVLDISRNIGNHVRGVAAAFQAENRCAPHKLDCGVEMHSILTQFRHCKSSIRVRKTASTASTPVSGVIPKRWPAESR